MRKITCRAKQSEEEKWDHGKLNEMQGLPWEPIPGRGIIQIKLRIYMPEIDAGDILDEPQVREQAPRRIEIGKVKISNKLGAPLDARDA